MSEELEKAYARFRGYGITINAGCDAPVEIYKKALDKMDDMKRLMSKPPVYVVEGNPGRDSADAFAYMLQGMKPVFNFGIDPAKKKESKMKTEHEIKCHPKYFTRLCDGSKPFEIRKNDRDYQVGDRLIIKEYDPEVGWPDHGSYGVISAEITYITDFAQVNGYVVLGLKILTIDA